MFGKVNGDFSDYYNWLLKILALFLFLYAYLLVSYYYYFVFSGQ